MEIRLATPADVEAIGEIARASHLSGTDSGSDPGYVSHLLRVGTVALAFDDGGAPVGFACSFYVDGVRMLADLYVRPDRQSRGAGRALLGAVLGDGPQMTFASHDPRAIALYSAHRMLARGALLYLRGPGDQVHVPGRDDRVVTSGPGVVAVTSGWGVEVRRVPVAEAVARERGWSGGERAADYDYWTSRPGGYAFLVDGPGGPAGVGCGMDGEISHLVVAAGADPAATVLAAVADVAGPVRLYLAGDHPAVPMLLGHGFQVEDFYLVMTSAEGAFDGRGAYHPGLL